MSPQIHRLLRPVMIQLRNPILGCILQAFLIQVQIPLKCLVLRLHLHPLLTPLNDPKPLLHSPAPPRQQPLWLFAFFRTSLINLPRIEVKTSSMDTPQRLIPRFELIELVLKVIFLKI